MAVINRTLSGVYDGHRQKHHGSLEPQYHAEGLRRNTRVIKSCKNMISLLQYRSMSPER